MNLNLLSKSIVAVTALVLSTTCVWSQDMGTPDEAKAMSQMAAAKAKENRDAAFAAFDQAGGTFQTKDLYVFCMDTQGKMVYHAKKPDLVGKNLIDFNKYGDKLFQDMIKVATTDGSGWVNYKWPHPSNDQVQTKASWIEAIDDTYFCGVGAYK